MSARRKADKPLLPFDQKLVLQQWIFSLLEAQDIYSLCDEEFRHPGDEKWDTENVTEYHRLLTQQFDKPDLLLQISPFGNFLLYASSKHDNVFTYE